MLDELFRRLPAQDRAEVATHTQAQLVLLKHWDAYNQSWANGGWFKGEDGQSRYAGVDYGNTLFQGFSGADKADSIAAYWGMPAKLMDPQRSLGMWRRYADPQMAFDGNSIPRTAGGSGVPRSEIYRGIMRDAVQQQTLEDHSRQWPWPISCLAGQWRNVQRCWPRPMGWTLSYRQQRQPARTIPALVCVQSK